MGTQKLAGEIDGQIGIPLFERQRVDRRVVLNPGIMDQDVDRAELVERSAKHLVDFVFLGNIGPMRVGAAAAVLTSLDHLLGAGFVADIIDDDVGPRMGYGNNDSPADARIRTRYQRFCPCSDRTMEHVRMMTSGNVSCSNGGCIRR